MNEEDRAWSVKHLATYPDFESFVRLGLPRKEIRSFVHFRPQREFICDNNGRVRLDFMGRYETLERDFHYICDKLNINATLPQLNIGESKRTYEDYYTEEMRKTVADVYESDINLLGYSFNGHR